MSFDGIAKLLKKNASLLLLLALVVRSLLLGADIGDAIVIIALSALVGFHSFQQKRETDELDELKQDVKLLKDSVQGLKIERAVRRNPNESNQTQGRFF